MNIDAACCANSLLSWLVYSRSHCLSSCCLVVNLQSVTPHGFRIGMKLEAVDKLNTVLTCVSTVADVLGDRLLIHFDGWEDSYDYWCDPSSPYIHPVGWCQENGKPLSPPNGKLYDYAWPISNWKHIRCLISTVDTDALVLYTHKQLETH